MKASQIISLNKPVNFKPSLFHPPFWLTNPHLQTILPKLFAPIPPVYRRAIYRDSLNESEVAYDFYDAPTANAHSRNTESTDSKLTQASNAPQKQQIPLIVLFHGLEGSSDSHYARALAHYIHTQGWHFVVAHFRSCGGIPAKGRVFYNAGDTAEVHHMLTLLNQDYANVYAVGVSLGGNALAKYMGEYGDEALCKAAVAISAPVDMSSAAMTLQGFVSQKIYTPYLLNPIIKKAFAHEVSEAEIAAIKTVNHLSDFDHIFTAPRHGYRSNNDYYRRSSALPHLYKVTQPLLLISAKDDPFIGFTATIRDVSDQVTIMETEHGGHIGYLRYQRNPDPDTGKRFDINWLGETISNYFQALGANQPN